MCRSGSEYYMPASHLHLSFVSAARLGSILQGGVLQRFEDAVWSGKFPDRERRWLPGKSRDSIRRGESSVANCTCVGTAGETFAITGEHSQETRQSGSGLDSPFLLLVRRRRTSPLTVGAFIHAGTRSGFSGRHSYSSQSQHRPAGYLTVSVPTKQGPIGRGKDKTGREKVIRREYGTLKVDHYIKELEVHLGQAILE